ncbi:MAG: CBS domain-containing protein [Polyangiaceae bacterium]
MKTQIECVTRESSAQHAAQKMRVANIGFLPVCDEDGRVLGAVTDRDIAVRLVAEGRSPSTPVREVMTNEVVACRPSDDLHRAEQIMSTQRKSRIVCVDDERHLVGVISLSDIAQFEEAERAGRTVKNVTDREALR